MTIGNRISTLRRERKLTQEYLAQKLKVSRQAVSKWENDQTAPDTYNLIALAELFQVSVEYLATGKESITHPLPEKAEQSNTDHGLHAGCAAICLILFQILLNIVGHVTGAFSHMVEIPLGNQGDRLGIWWLGYGDSLFAIVLVVLEVLAVLVAVILMIAAILDNCRHKSE